MPRASSRQVPSRYRGHYRGGISATSTDHVDTRVADRAAKQLIQELTTNGYDPKTGRFLLNTDSESVDTRDDRYQQAPGPEQRDVPEDESRDTRDTTYYRGHSPSNRGTRRERLLRYHSKGSGSYTNSAYSTRASSQDSFLSVDYSQAGNETSYASVDTNESHRRNRSKVGRGPKHSARPGRGYIDPSDPASKSGSSGSSSSDSSLSDITDKEFSKFLDASFEQSMENNAYDRFEELRRKKKRLQDFKRSKSEGGRTETPPRPAARQAELNQQKKPSTRTNALRTEWTTEPQTVDSDPTFDKVHIPITEHDRPASTKSEPGAVKGRFFPDNDSDVVNIVPVNQRQTINRSHEDTEEELLCEETASIKTSGTLESIAEEDEEDSQPPAPPSGTNSPAATSEDQEDVQDDENQSTALHPVFSALDERDQASNASHTESESDSLCRPRLPANVRATRGRSQSSRRSAKTTPASVGSGQSLLSSEHPNQGSQGEASKTGSGPGSSVQSVVTVGPCSDAGTEIYRRSLSPAKRTQERNNFFVAEDGEADAQLQPPRKMELRPLVDDSQSTPSQMSGSSRSQRPRGGQREENKTRSTWGRMTRTRRRANKSGSSSESSRSRSSASRSIGEQPRLGLVSREELFRDLQEQRVDNDPPTHWDDETDGSLVGQFISPDNADIQPTSDGDWSIVSRESQLLSEGEPPSCAKDETSKAETKAKAPRGLLARIMRSDRHPSKPKETEATTEPRTARVGHSRASESSRGRQVSGSVAPQESSELQSSSSSCQPKMEAASLQSNPTAVVPRSVASGGDSVPSIDRSVPKLESRHPVASSTAGNAPSSLEASRGSTVPSLTSKSSNFTNTSNHASLGSTPSERTDWVSQVETEHAQGSKATVHVERANESSEDTKSQTLEVREGMGVSIDMPPQAKVTDKSNCWLRNDLSPSEMSELQNNKRSIPMLGAKTKKKKVSPRKGFMSFFKTRKKSSTCQQEDSASRTMEATVWRMPETDTRHEAGSKTNKKTPLGRIEDQIVPEDRETPLSSTPNLNTVPTASLSVEGRVGTVTSSETPTIATTSPIGSETRVVTRTATIDPTTVPETNEGTKIVVDTVDSDGDSIPPPEAAPPPDLKDVLKLLRESKHGQQKKMDPEGHNSGGSDRHAMKETSREQKERQPNDSTKQMRVEKGAAVMSTNAEKSRPEEKASGAQTNPHASEKGRKESVESPIIEVANSEEASIPKKECNTPQSSNRTQSARVTRDRNGNVPNLDMKLSRSRALMDSFSQGTIENSVDSVNATTNDNNSSGSLQGGTRNRAMVTPGANYAACGDLGFMAKDPNHIPDSSLGRKGVRFSEDLAMVHEFPRDPESVTVDSRPSLRSDASEFSEEDGSLPSVQASKPKRKGFFSWLRRKGRKRGMSGTHSSTLSHENESCDDSYSEYGHSIGNSFSTEGENSLNEEEDEGNENSDQQEDDAGKPNTLPLDDEGIEMVARRTKGGKSAILITESGAKDDEAASGGPPLPGQMETGKTGLAVADQPQAKPPLRLRFFKSSNHSSTVTLQRKSDQDMGSERPATAQESRPSAIAAKAAPAPPASLLQDFAGTTSKPVVDSTPGVNPSVHANVDTVKSPVGLRKQGRKAKAKKGVPTGILLKPVVTGNTAGQGRSMLSVDSSTRFDQSTKYTEGSAGYVTSGGDLFSWLLPGIFDPIPKPEQAKPIRKLGTHVFADDLSASTDSASKVIDTEQWNDILTTTETLSHQYNEVRQADDDTSKSVSDDTIKEVNDAISKFKEHAARLGIEEKDLMEAVKKDDRSIGSLRDSTTGKTTDFVLKVGGATDKLVEVFDYFFNPNVSGFANRRTH